MALTFGFTDAFIAYGAVMRREPKVISVKFDDGYELRMRKGLNFDMQTWDITYPALTLAQAVDVEAFLDFHGGTDWFFWKPPRYPSPRRFICRRWTREPVTPKIDRFTLTLEEVADIV